MKLRFRNYCLTVVWLTIFFSGCGGTGFQGGSDVAQGRQALFRGDYPTAWSLRVGFVELIQQDTYRVLGYKADRIDSFLGLPITMCPSGSRNQLITATGSISIPELEAIWRTQSYAND